MSHSYKNPPPNRSHDSLGYLMHQAKQSKSKKMTLGDIYKTAIENDGYAVLIASLAVVIILPVGAVPGVPAIAGAIMCLLYLGVMISSYSPNLPKPISRIKVQSRIVIKVCDFMNSCLSRINRISKRDRLLSFNSDFSLRVMAFLGLILSVVMIVVGFIPFVPTILMSPVLLFSLGIILRDGLFTVMGYGVASILLFTAIGTFS